MSSIRPAPTPEALPAPAGETRRGHRRRRIVLVVVGVALLAGAGWFAVQWNDRGPQEASVSDAVDRFRTSQAGDAAPADDRVVHPAPGVYSYEGEGEERLSFLSTSQPQGPELPATVTLDGTCWTFSIEYNSFHRQAWTWCREGDRIVETGGTVDQRFDFGAFKMDERSVSTCSPAFVAVDLRDEPGATHAVDCTTASETTDASNRSRGTNTFVGRETMTIDGEEVEVLHYRFDRTISGGQEGGDEVHVWYDARSGLPLRRTAEIEVASPAPPPLDEVVYREAGEWTITELAPKT